MTDITDGKSTLSSFAGAIGGPVDSFMSLIRKKDIPELLKKGEGTAIVKSDSQDWRVKIHMPPIFLDSYKSDLLDPLIKSDNSLVFPLTPSIILQHSAHYNALQPIHSNYPYQNYQHSSVETITITGEFIVENKSDAQYWLATQHFLRTATKMFYGDKDLGGNPPVICKLSGYGDYVFNKVPIIITSYTVDLPQDVDYISSGVGVDVADAPSKGPQSWAPVSSQITISVTPIYSRKTIEQFSLKDFVKGSYLGSNDTKGFI